MKTNKNANCIKFNRASMLANFKLVAMLFLFLFPGILNFASAQNPAMQNLNHQLRTLFTPLQAPVPARLFLYEMSAKTSDPIYWQPVCNTSLGNETWHELYSELYHAAYDTSSLLSPDSIYPRFLRVEKNTVPIFILNYDYNMFKDDALISSKYFDFSEIDSSITDKKRNESPYERGSIFSAAPLDTEYPFTNPTFQINPDLIFNDSYNAIHFSNSQDRIFKIDFGDGNGYVTINPTITTNYPVNYNSAGNKTIRTAVFAKENQLLCLSVSKIYIKNNYIEPVPTETYNYPGIEATLYSPCGGSSSMPGKMVIYLSGFDVMDMDITNNKYGRNVNEIYAEMISNQELVQLKNFGYSFLVVDWKNSRTDIRFNALYLVNLLEKLKCEIPEDGQQFVIVGESMGGLVARFAMNYMESTEYLNNDISPFFVETNNPSNFVYLELHPELLTIQSNWKRCKNSKRHNTRLLITLDTPNQGANIPLSIQKLFKGIEDLFKILPFGEEMTIGLKANNFALSGMAAKQMLLYHVDFPQGNSYTQAPEYHSFFAQLKAMGNYPRFAKLVGMSNGSLAGMDQDNPHTNLFRNAGDLLLGLNLDKSISVLGNVIPLFSCSAQFKTNPNGYGNIIHASMGFYFHIPIVYFFGIKFQSVFIPTLLNYNSYASVLSFCTKSGGFVDLARRDPGEGGFFDENWVNTDGTRFCFVPLESALDLGKIATFPLPGSDIESMDIQTKLSLTPYDVIIAYPGNGIGNNHKHVNYRNPYIYNSSILSPSQNINSQIFASCTIEDNVGRTLLSLEIGDEQLFLENCSLKWNSSYQAEFDIHVNERNRQYEYPNYFNANFVVEGCYSKSEPFIIDASAQAFFYSHSQNPVTGIGLSYSPPFSWPYTSIDGPVTICCHNFGGERYVAPKQITTQKSNLSFTISPNPLSSNLFQLSLGELETNPIELKIYDTFGKEIFNHKFSNQQNETKKYEFNLAEKPVSNGLYFVQVNGKNYSITQKLNIINH